MPTSPKLPTPKSAQGTGGSSSKGGGKQHAGDGSKTGGGNGDRESQTKPARNKGESPMDANVNGILGPDPAGGFLNIGKVRAGD